jgi:hypothetical protein
MRDKETQANTKVEGINTHRQTQRLSGLISWGQRDSYRVPPSGKGMYRICWDLTDIEA